MCLNGPRWELGWPQEKLGGPQKELDGPQKELGGPMRSWQGLRGKNDKKENRKCPDGNGRFLKSVPENGLT